MTGVEFPIIEVGDDILRVDGLPHQNRDALFRVLLLSGDWLDVVPGRRSLTVRFDPLTVDPADARGHFAAQLAIEQNDVASSLGSVTIPICYDPPFSVDLEAISKQLGRSPKEIIDAHADTAYRVDFLGFTPGFAYLAPEGSNGLDVPRLKRPRQSVPAGSIGIVGGTTGLYALAGPGGWPIIGRTPMNLFNPSIGEPAILSPGVTVRFETIGVNTFEDWTE